MFGLPVDPAAISIEIRRSRSSTVTCGQIASSPAISIASCIENFWITISAWYWASSVSRYSMRSRIAPVRALVPACWISASVAVFATWMPPDRASWIPHMVSSSMRTSDRSNRAGSIRLYGSSQIESRTLCPSTAGFIGIHSAYSPCVIFLTCCGVCALASNAILGLDRLRSSAFAVRVRWYSSISL